METKEERLGAYFTRKVVIVVNSRMKRLILFIRKCVPCAENLITGNECSEAILPDIAL